MTHNQNHVEWDVELARLIAAIACAAFWLWIASWFTEVDWLLRLPELGGIFYVGLTLLLGRLKQ